MTEKDIVVFSEDASFAAELIGGAVELAGATGGSVAAYVIGGEAEAKAAIAAGADKAYVVAAVDGLPIEGYASALAAKLDADRPAAVLVGATNRGKGFAGMLAAQLGTGSANEIRNPRVEDGRIVVERMVYGGLAVSTQACDTLPFVLTASKLTFSALEADASRDGEIEVVDTPAAYGARVTAVEAKAGDGVDLSAAKSIVVFGRGVDKQEDIQMFRDLAQLTGSELGCTRPIAEDYHWMGTDRYVGLSGKTVKPQLYMTIGTSGQIQQMAGAQDSRVVVAICKDDKAPVFNVCDYGIVGDLYEIVPAINAQLRSM